MRVRFRAMSDMVVEIDGEKNAVRLWLPIYIFMRIFAHIMNCSAVGFHDPRLVFRIEAMPARGVH